MRTFRAVVIVLAAAAIFSNVAVANEYAGSDTAGYDAGPFGIGFGSAGYISGISGKLLLGESAAIQGVVGGTYFGGWGGLAAAMDYTMGMGTLWEPDFLRMSWYLGGGGSLYMSSWGTAFGVNAVAGISFRLATLPIEFATEIRPTFFIGNHWSSNWAFPLRIMGGGAIRWYL